MKTIKKILIVEDNEINQDLIMSILKKAGYDVVQAYNGYEALTKLKEEEIDIIFMDIQMPEMDGFETTRLIRQDENLKDIVIVAMTAYILDQNENVFIESGMDYYIPKPLKIKEVINLLEEIKGNIIECERNNEIEDNDGSPVNIRELLNEMADNEDFMRKTVEVMLKSYPEKLRRIDDGFEKNNFYEIERAAHSFKGSIGILSKKICNLSLQLEIESKAELKNKSEITFENLKNEMERVNKYFEEYFKNKI